MRRRFGEAHIARDDGREKLVAEVLLQLRGDLLRQVMRASYIVRSRPSISSVGIQVLLHLAQRADEVGQAFQCVVLAPHRDQHAVRRAQRVEREQVQRRRAIDQDVVVFLGNSGDGGLQVGSRP